MKVTEPEQAQRFAVLYQATIDHAVSGAPDLMARLVAHTRATLRDLESTAADRRERERLTGSRRQLNQFESDAIARFSDELEAAFVRLAVREPATVSLAAQPHFDDIAGMDATQVRQSVESARVRHAVQIAADHALAELSQLICTMLGLEQVQLERNPLRPAVYVDALAAALSQLSVPAVVRQGWLSMMSGALGQELDIYYRQLCSDLRERGVAVGAAPGAASGGLGMASGPDTHALTLERLRQLLVHGPADVQDEIAQQFHTEFEDTVDASAPQSADGGAAESGADDALSAFGPTVPAALDAVQDMDQMARVVRRIETLQPDVQVGLQAASREHLRRSAHGLDQSLALEVVALMVDNICHDRRLLRPVQQLVARLEPALLRLALVDPRFFSHKQHPARRLLHEITHRSIAFESVDSRGFSGFMEPLHDAVMPLADGAIDNAEPFDQALARLVAVWDEPAGRERRQIARAVHALQQAEQRTALAAIMVREVLARPDAVLVPSTVLDFLCGPWAQVVAHARITDRSGADDPGAYAGLIDELMWSAQPTLTHQDVPALRRLMPRLQQVLQQGLASIECPAQQTQDFFAMLGQLHQRGLEQPAFADTEIVERTLGGIPEHSRWTESDSTWLVPSEAQVSGFIDMPFGAAAPADAVLAGQLVVGTWVALKAEGSWSRTRLAWVSANGSLLLFSDVLGFIQSLSRRACEQLHALGDLRIISTDPVEDALDAVARTALRNSVDIRF
ncbi:MAG: DUF1631 family protein [Betaproteobacteria bacterium]